MHDTTLTCCCSTGWSSWRCPERSQQMVSGLARQVPEGASAPAKALPRPQRLSWAPRAPVVPRVPLSRAAWPGLLLPSAAAGRTEPVVVTSRCAIPTHSLLPAARRRSTASESMAQVYRSSPGTGTSTLPVPLEERRAPDKPGSPFTSCGLDGLWYRALA